MHKLFLTQRLINSNNQVVFKNHAPRTWRGGWQKVSWTGVNFKVKFNGHLHDVIGYIYFNAQWIVSYWSKETTPQDNRAWEQSRWHSLMVAPNHLITFVLLSTIFCTPYDNKITRAAQRRRQYNLCTFCRPYEISGWIYSSLLLIFFTFTFKTVRMAAL